MDFFYPPNLPIVEYLNDISELVKNNQVVIIAGDTGSGKTTQIAKICLESFPEATGLIGCTQPRRIAATSVSDQVRHELREQSGLVGCKIRFRDQTSSKTRIKFMTDGVLLAETRQDRFLKKYDIIIIDEAHERSLNIDFLLGYLKQLLVKRNDLKIIVTSATIDTKLFSRHFSNAPVLQIEGRTYPVDLIYSSIEENEEDIGFIDHCVDTVSNICNHFPPGDILVFLPTEKDIRTCCEILEGRQSNHIVLPMFGRLQSSDQQKIFKQYHQNKIVIATNVAETSVTVPGISYVVDTGLARISSYNPRSRTTSLPVVRVSQASCNQRSGRCGRIGPGTCFRLYSEEDFQSRPPYTIPEIQRSNLAEVILQMVSLNLGDPFAFPFLDPPQKNAIRDGYRILEELGAISSSKHLTKHGRLMAQLPIDPVISRIIIEAAQNNCLSDIMIIASALAIQDPRIRPSEKEQKADEAHKVFAHPHSDFFVLLNIWKSFHSDKQSFSWSRLKRFCQNNYLSFQRMKEWIDLHEQLQRILQKLPGFTFECSEPIYEQIHKSLLSGFFRQCARRKKGSVYQTGGNREIMIFPGSHQFLKSGDFILAGFLMETNRLYAMTVATIEPEWIEHAAIKYCSYSWTTIRWQQKTGRVIADETVALQGLPLIKGRIVNFANRDRSNIPEARSIFIQKALVEGKINLKADFLSKNLSLISKWKKAEHRLRKKDVVIEDSTIYQFYQKNLPAAVYDRSTLIKHLKKKGASSLLMSEGDILLRVPENHELADYPTSITLNSGEISLTYCFEPGNKTDGVTAHIPVHMLDRFKDDYFEWLVPGLLREKTMFLLKGLPKRIRKHLIPLSGTTDRILDSMIMYNGNYYGKLTGAIFKMFKISVHKSDWPLPLPDHLVMRFSIFDPDGNELMSGRDFLKFQKKIQSKPETLIKANVSPDDEKRIREISKNIYTTWSFSTIPSTIPLYTIKNQSAGNLFAALQKCSDHQGVKIVFLHSEQETDAVNTLGTRYLFRLALKDQSKMLKKHSKISLTGPSSLWLTKIYGSNAKAVDTLVATIFRLIFNERYPTIISQEQFNSTLADVKKMGFFKTGKEIIDQIMSLLRQRNQLSETINKYESLSIKKANRTPELYEELRCCLERILPIDFLDTFSETNFTETSRYIKSLAIRTERAYSNPHKDMQKQKAIKIHEKNIISFQKNCADAQQECQDLFNEYCYLVAEMRVSLFSPELKTKTAVSEKNISRLWKQLSSLC